MVRFGRVEVVMGGGCSGIGVFFIAGNQAAFRLLDAHSGFQVGEGRWAWGAE